MNNIKLKKVIARPVLVPFRISPATASAKIEDAAIVLIDVETTGAITGSSYLFVYSRQMLEPTVTCLNGINDLITGKKLAPMDIEIYLKKKFRINNTGGILGQAMSGIDMACWDAHSKALGMPLCAVLGAEPKPIKSYNSCGLWIQEPEKVAKEANSLVAEADFNAIKARLGRTEFKEDLLTIRNIKDAVGDKIKIMCDFNQSQNRNEGLRKCRLLDAENLYWIEEPIRHDDYEGCGKINSEIDTPLQIGENLINTYEMQKAIDCMAGDYYMPDVQRIGGVSGWLRAATLAEVNDIDLSSHLFPEISYHLLCASPTAHWLEYMDWANPILEEPLKIENGYAAPPEVPGINIAWNERAVKKYLAK